MRKLLFTICALLSATFTLAQDTESLINKALSDIQCPTALIMTNNGDVNVRQQPNTKAKKTGSISRDVVYGVIEEQDGWYKVQSFGWDDNVGRDVVKTGWVSGTVTHKTVNKPITADMQNDAYGYVDTQDPDAMEDQTYINRVYIRPDGVCVAWVGNSFEGSLYLGRYVNNVCCFKYMMPLGSTIYNEDFGLNDDDVSLVKDGNAKNGFWISKSILDGEEYGSIKFGSDYVIKLKCKDSDYGSSDLNLTVFDSDALLETIFGKTIKANKTIAYYINSTLLSGKYMSNH